MLPFSKNKEVYILNPYHIHGLCRFGDLIPPYVFQQNYLAHEELLIAVEMLSAVALLNQALESNDLVSVQNQLRSPTMGFNNLDETYVER